MAWSGRQRRWGVGLIRAGTLPSRSSRYSCTSGWTVSKVIGREETLALAPLGPLAHSTIYTRATEGLQDSARAALEESISRSGC